MKFRCLVSSQVLVGVLVAGLSSPGPAAGQTGDALRTPWGDPDLQGIWVGSTLCQ